MRSFHRITLLALPLLNLVSCAEPASPTQERVPKPIYANANEAFRDLLNALPEESLHAALNSLDHFQAGVFESDRHGVERVHNENPPLATKLIVAAVQDLKKRQGPAGTNGTTTQAPPPPASSETPSSQSPGGASSAPPPPPPSSKASPPVIVPVPVSTTDGNGKATVVTSAILSEPTASVAIPVTTTDGQGQTVVATQTKPAVIFTATNSAGSAFVTTSAVDFAPTPGQVLTTTNAQGSTFLTTYTPGGGRVSSIVLLTTKGPNGQPMVVTSYTYIDPAAATNTDGQPEPSGTSPGKPGLQKGAASKNRAMEAAVLGGAVGGAFALWI